MTPTPKRMSAEERAESLLNLIKPFVELPKLFGEHIAESIDQACDDAVRDFVDIKSCPDCYAGGFRAGLEAAAEVAENYLRFDPDDGKHGLDIANGIRSLYPTETKEEK